MAKRYSIIAAVLFSLAAGTALAADQQLKFPFAGAVHALGAVAYKDGGEKSWTWDRGRITALSASSITLTRRDKVQVSFTISDSTLVRNDGGSYTQNDLKLGQAATVISQNGNALIIRNIRGEGAPSGADSSAIEGPAKGAITGSVDALYKDGSSETYAFDRGRITDLADGSVTIVRQDKKSLTFSFDSTVPVWQKGKPGTTALLTVGQGGMFFSQDGKLAVVHGLSQAKTPSASK